LKAKMNEAYGYHDATSKCYMQMLQASNRRSNNSNCNKQKQGVETAAGREVKQQSNTSDEHQDVEYDMRDYPPPVGDRWPPLTKSISWLPRDTM